MRCFTPLHGFASRKINPSGKRSIVFNAREGLHDRPMRVACGQCIGCRLSYSQMWGIRGMHEASLYGENNSFITLTYSNNKIPWDHGISLSAMQLFNMRLRFKYGEGIRIMYCGEYGDKSFRPHYHAILFNHSFADRRVVGHRGPHLYYESESLSDLWSDPKDGVPYGKAIIGNVSMESVAYVARYVTKKIKGKALKGVTRHDLVDQDSGEIFHTREHEFMKTSRGKLGGLGRPWLEKYWRDVYPDDFVVVNGKKSSVPRFYDQQLEKFNPELYQEIKSDRVDEGFSRRGNSTLSRLEVREKVTKSRISQLKRII